MTAPPDGVRDESDVLRVMTCRQTFTSLADLAFNQIRVFGASHALVLSRILEILTELANATSRSSRRACLAKHAALAAEAADRGLVDGADRAAVNARLAALPSDFTAAAQIRPIPPAADG